MNNLNENNRSAPRENGLNLPRVPPEESGKGLPYAPENWPMPGDIWRWKVGRRVVSTGYYADRYLYLPDRLRKSEKAMNIMRRRHAFASKLSVERYIREYYPNANVEEFFASFNWRIPATRSPLSIDNLSDSLPEVLIEDGAADTSSGLPCCKAGNTMCCSINQEGPMSIVAAPCDHCCSDPQFCLYCCCVLCRKSVSSEYDGYTYVKCEAKQGEEYICGHLGHIGCALRCFMAGKVGGIFDLDAEYLCRRCDAKTDLLPHAVKLLEACKSINIREDIKKTLNLGLCILRGSQKENAKLLLNNIELAITKVDDGTTPEDIWKEKSDSSSFPVDNIYAGVSRHEAAPVVQSYEDSLNFSSNFENLPYVSSESKAKYENFKIEVDEVLCALRIAQMAEYNIAEENLNVQKDHIPSMFQQLDKKRSELGNGSSDVSLMSVASDQKDQVKQEMSELRDIER